MTVSDKQLLRFLLVPDAGAARRVRRIIAEQGARYGVVVGTWPELMEWGHRLYLLNQSAEDAEQVFRDTLLELDSAFWSDSLQVAPDETTEAVEAAFVEVLGASQPGVRLGAEDLSALPERARGHLHDLITLHDKLAGRLPEDLTTIEQLLAADAGDALYGIRVYRVDGFPHLTRWQTMLVEKLNRDASGEDDAGAGLMKALVQVSDGASGAAQGVLGHMQTQLFVAEPTRIDQDHTAQWVGVRDFLQEAEVAAGMAQQLLDAHAGLSPAEIGLLIPDSFEYSTALEDAFRHAGLALSGLPVDLWRRDLGGEALFHFLYCRQAPASAMAQAVCLASPLMPWSREQGASLAQRVMDGDYRLLPANGAGLNMRRMLDLLREADARPATLVTALGEFVSLLDGGDARAEHVAQARRSAEEICGLLEQTADIDWTAIRRAASPKFIRSGEQADFNREGITVWRETQEPWRGVRFLIVLGFSQGHYPTPGGESPVFSEDDLRVIRDTLDLAVSLPSAELHRRRARLKRQLGAVREAVTFLVPRRKPDGSEQGPSESLVFVQQLLEGCESSDDLILELDAADDRAHIRHLALAPAARPTSPRGLDADDLHFDRDLLALRCDTKGVQRPESPSSLETLMVSRLAWLLRRLDAEPQMWAPEGLDAMLLGSIAHEVFEGLFQPGATPPSASSIQRRLDDLLDQTLQRLAPFMRSPQWQVERRNLASGLLKAAQAWSAALRTLGAEVLASEEWLQGTWSDIAVHGQADLILGLPGDRLLVVDYKRARSSGRRPRMEKGFDSQASLYRAMLQSGGPKNDGDGPLLKRIRAARSTGIVYYMLIDQIALADSLLPQSDSIPGWQTLDDDVAGNAMALIQRRLGEVREGHVFLNRDGDGAFFEKQAGLKPYALENSPLIPLFTVPGPAQEEE